MHDTPLNYEFRTKIRRFYNMKQVIPNYGQVSLYEKNPARMIILYHTRAYTVSSYKGVGRYPLRPIHLGLCSLYDELTHGTHSISQ